VRGRMGERKTQDAGRRTQGKPEWDKGRKKTQDAGRRTQDAGKENENSKKNSVPELVFCPPARGGGGYVKYCRSVTGRKRDIKNPRQKNRGSALPLSKNPEGFTTGKCSDFLYLVLTFTMLPSI